MMRPEYKTKLRILVIAPKMDENSRGRLHLILDAFHLLFYKSSNKVALRGIKFDYIWLVGGWYKLPKSEFMSILEEFAQGLQVHKFIDIPDFFISALSESYEDMKGFANDEALSFIQRWFFDYVSREYKINGFDEMNAMIPRTEHYWDWKELSQGADRIRTYIRRWTKRYLAVADSMDAVLFSNLDDHEIIRKLIQHWEGLPAIKKLSFDFIKELESL